MARKSRKQIAKKLEEIGFTAPFQFYYWKDDGWYVDSDELNHQYIGQNSWCVMERLLKQTKEDVLRGRVPSS